jgi:hypothetical protein
MKDHLLHPLADGGHGHDADSYLIAYRDHADLHEEDHHPEAWWAAAITHDHTDETAATPSEPE